ncbi:hypothetical protein PoB_003657800 [Plakobranchus ocellatus]|uniref:Uncharacterized protein n=1 Tax=Plakobranchus ocellatus TaxID=259542 RepID=A0AAV4ARU6_9GAST|nr:hypothetical protein PoB_003657800 [Plakobranchus ocellatus]
MTSDEYKVSHVRESNASSKILRLETDSRVRLAAARNILESVWREPHPRQSYSSQPGGRHTDSKVVWRPPGRLQSVFGGRYRDCRVFLAAAMLTLESF